MNLPPLMKASKPQLTAEPSLTKKQTTTSTRTYQKRHTYLNTTHRFIGWNFAISRFLTIFGIRNGTQKPSTTLRSVSKRCWYAKPTELTPLCQLQSLKVKSLEFNLCSLCLLRSLTFLCIYVFCLFKLLGKLL